MRPRPQNRFARWACARLFLAIALALAASHPAAAAPWLGTGPFGAQIRALASAPGARATAYAGTNSGFVFRTADAGASWTQASQGLPGLPILALAVDPRDARRVWTGTGAGLFNSTNSGTSWSLVATTENLRVLGIAIPAGSPDVIYVHGINTQGQHIVALLAMNGLPIGPPSTGLAGLVIRALAVDPLDAARVYAATNDGVYRSDDQGAVWQPTGAGAPASVLSLAVSRLAPGRLYAGTGGSGVFTSTNGGASWAPANGGIANQVVTALLADVGDSVSVVATTEDGLYFTGNGGASWQASVAPARVAGVQLAPGVEPGDVYAGTRGAGVFVSRDRGAGFLASSTGMLRTQVQALAIDPSLDSRVLAATSGGLYRSTNGGLDWTPSNTGMTHADVAAVAFSPQRSATLLAGTIDGGAFRSIDAGITWQRIAGLGFPRVSALAPDGVEAGVWYAATAGGGVYVSSDDGATWQARNSGLTDLFLSRVVASPIAAGTAYAVSANRVFITLNRGMSWQAVGSGLPTSGLNDLALATESPSLVFVGTDTGLFRSENGGISWSTRIGGGLPAGAGISTLHAVPTRQRVLYAGTTTGAVYRSFDGGENWIAIGSDLPAGVRVSALVATLDRDNGLFAGTGGRGAYVAQQQCGDGVVDVGELCDGGTGPDGGACPADCGIAASACAGDCDGSGDVTVDEIVRGVSIALGNAALSECEAMDRDRSGTVTVDEIITALVHALSGCPTD